ncbi:hypothetical protein CUB86_04865 [Pseudomonas syringae pv. actinidiae]|uniref:Uncharacterized protein n=1 Tax=Pseudomonas syringae pv. actinidiae TaxID=103796 RepID=A0AAU8XMF9_PSESF|nr:hypothetical protein CT122_26075 [Pseudomonas syringae pv. actinidiae]PIN62594.1 hypothetical protein CUB86_04865 [Pseudomonas syringae pv. actinidiae]
MFAKGPVCRQQFVAASQEDAERPERHADAERRTIVALVGRLSFRTLCAKRTQVRFGFWPKAVGANRATLRLFAKGPV